MDDLFITVTFKNPSDALTMRDIAALETPLGEITEITFQPCKPSGITVAMPGTSVNSGGDE